MKVQLNRLTRVCRGATHNAFGDIVLFNDRLLVCYRQGAHHMSNNGIIVVAEINDLGQPVRFQCLTSPEGDLRDPHFCIDNDRLYLLAHQRWLTSLGAAKTYTWFSGDGLSWSSRHDPGPDNWWLWRATTYQGRQWGLAYHRPSEQLDLYAGSLRGKMHKVVSACLSKTHHQLGYPTKLIVILLSKVNLLQWPGAMPTASRHSWAGASRLILSGNGRISAITLARRYYYRLIMIWL